MKKERLITRTIINNKISAKVYNDENDSISVVDLEIAGKFSDKAEMKKACQDRLSGSGLEVLKIVDVVSTEKLYGIPENVFMIYATEIPPRNIKEEEEED